MKVFVLGTRGIPNLQGGVETHCQQLYPLLNKYSLEIHILCRSPYFNFKKKIKSYKGITLHYLYSPKLKSVEAIIHTFISILYSKLKGADILHIHSIGPAILIPFARLLRLKVIHTHHGSDYKRQKWGIFAKYILKLGEKYGYKYSNILIHLSTDIKKELAQLYGDKPSLIIPNGVLRPRIIKSQILKKLNIKKKYIFALGRFVEEKGFVDLIQAHHLSMSKLPLIIAGKADHETPYSKKIKSLGEKYNIVLPGMVLGDDLWSLYENATFIVLPSYHEGLPIVILEALAMGKRCLLTNITANIIFPFPKNYYFPPGDIQGFARKIKWLENIKPTTKESKKYIEEVRLNYSWDKIAKDTFEKGFMKL